MEGNLIVTGTTKGSSTFLNNFITLRYNAVIGDTIWTSTFEGRGGLSCHIDAQGYLYITGTPMEWQGLTLKYSNAGMVGIKQINNRQKLNIKVYPNPVSDILNLSFDNKYSSDPILNIYNSAGKLQRVEVLNQYQQQINISDLKDGIYILEIKSGDQTETQKLILKRKK